MDNRSGTGGNVATETVAPDRRDTVFIALSTGITVNPTFYKLPFSGGEVVAGRHTRRRAQYMLVIHPGVPARALADLVAYAKQKPGARNVATAGTGTPLHLAAELLRKHAGIQLTHIAYKGGGPAAASVLAGETQMNIGSFAASLPHIRGGKLRTLATTGDKRANPWPSYRPSQNGAQMASRIKAETALWAGVIRDAGIRVQ